ncbi:hypothetical protein VTI74DRAFT_6785 [Chaetomium olivicolor]
MSVAQASNKFQIRTPNRALVVPAACFIHTPRCARLYPMHDHHASGSCGSGTLHLAHPGPTSILDRIGDFLIPSIPDTSLFGHHQDSDPCHRSESYLRARMEVLAVAPPRQPLPQVSRNTFALWRRRPRSAYVIDILGALRHRRLRRRGISKADW